MLVRPLGSRPRDLQAQALTYQVQSVYAKAWGKPWPHSGTKTINKTEISGKSGSVIDDNEVDGVLAEKIHIPPTFSYLCLGGIRDLKRALDRGIDEAYADTLVVRSEYIQLRMALEEGIYKHKGIVVTGHPGIG
jgi:hypothetical protein